MRQKLSNVGRALVALALVTAPIAFAEGGGGGNGAPFTGSELSGASAVVTSFLAVGATITIALVIYRLGKRAINRV